MMQIQMVKVKGRGEREESYKFQAVPIQATFVEKAAKMVTCFHNTAGVHFTDKGSINRHVWTGQYNSE